MTGGVVGGVVVLILLLVLVWRCRSKHKDKFLREDDDHKSVSCFFLRKLHL